MSSLFWLSDEQWAAIASLMPEGGVGPKRLDDRVVISGIIHVLKSGCAWRDCPREYGPYMTVFNRFNRWKNRGLWQRILDHLVDGQYLPELAAFQNGTGAGYRFRRNRKRKSPDTRLHAEASLDGSVHFPQDATRQSATEALHRLIQLHQDEPISNWIDDIVDWHFKESAQVDDGAWIPGMAGGTDRYVAQAVERFHQQRFKMTIDRLTAEIVDLRIKLLTALACMSSYAEDPQNNVSATRATLKMLLSELTRPGDPDRMPDAKASNHG